MDITLTHILHRLLPDIEWVMNDDDLTTLNILTPNTVKPTQAQVDQMRQTILAEREAAAQAQAQAKANAEAKLAALGLTADEIAALSK